MARELRVALVGPNAELGKVRAADVARLILGIDGIVARAAQLAAGQSPKGGRRRSAVYKASFTTLVGLEEGSVVSVLRLADRNADEDALDLGGIQDLTDIALRQTIRSAQADTAAHPALIQAVSKLTDQLRIGERHDAIWVQAGSNSADRVIIDAETRKQLHELRKEAHTFPRAGTVSGTLVEADFEKLTARLRTPAGQKLEVMFNPETADSVQMALRNPAHLVGEITFEPGTSTVASIALRDISSASQMHLDYGNAVFWASPTVLELQQLQGAKAPGSAEELKDREASRDEIDNFLMALGIEAI